MIRKDFMLDESDLAIIQSIRENQAAITNDSAAVRYILREYEKIVEEKKDTSEKLLLAVQRNIEQNTNIILDVLNTLLVINDVNVCYPVSCEESPVIKQSRERGKEKKAHLKQQKDYKKRKQQRR